MQESPYDGQMSALLPQEVGDIAEEARRLLLELDPDMPGASRVTADCRPALDVLETADSIEVIVDVPGVPLESMRVAVQRNTLLIVGAKRAGTADARAARYHLAERSYGCFARAVGLSGAFDVGRARAVAANGLLRVILPLVSERRGRAFMIPIARE